MLQNAYWFSGRGDTIVAPEGLKKVAAAKAPFVSRGDCSGAYAAELRCVMLVNPAKFPHVKVALGQAFIDWLVSPEGQQVIAGYKIGGQQFFFPNAKP